jgi:hypothetical protein
MKVMLYAYTGADDFPELIKITPPGIVSILTDDEDKAGSEPAENGSVEKPIMN